MLKDAASSDERQLQSGRLNKLCLDDDLDVRTDADIAGRGIDETEDAPVDGAARGKTDGRQLGYRARFVTAVERRVQSEWRRNAKQRKLAGNAQPVAFEHLHAGRTPGGPSELRDVEKLVAAKIAVPVTLVQTERIISFYRREVDARTRHAFRQVGRIEVNFRGEPGEARGVIRQAEVPDTPEQARMRRVEQVAAGRRLYRGLCTQRCSSSQAKNAERRECSSTFHLASLSNLMTFQQRLVLVDECSAAFLAIFTTKAVFVRVRAGLEITLGQIGTDRSDDQLHRLHGHQRFARDHISLVAGILLKTNKNLKLLPLTNDYIADPANGQSRGVC